MFSHDFRHVLQGHVWLTCNIFKHGNKKCDTLYRAVLKFDKGHWSFLKVLQSSHSSAIWCIMANVSMWCLPTNIHKEWDVGFYYRNAKESYTFQWQKPLILQHDVDLDISLTYLSSLSKNQHAV